MTLAPLPGSATEPVGATRMMGTPSSFARVARHMRVPLVCIDAASSMTTSGGRWRAASTAVSTPCLMLTE
ncbi:MAG: hypothetical protein A2Y93_06055 [Chloroflexi bacterium RBG_13_68_17]|nr:MAG: hypothetical protein A2Y93_06055 [Chloroflexi bacterium RBG_13_68_17]